MSIAKSLYENTKPERELYFELGRTLSTQNKFRKAIEFLQEALRKEGTTPEDWEVNFLLGECYKSLSKTREAFASYIEAALQAEGNKSACYEQAQSLINPVSALDLQQWLEKKMEAQDQMNGSAEDIYAMKELIDYGDQVTRSRHEEAFESLPSRSDMNQILEEVHSFITEGNFKSALSKVEEALSIDPGNYEILFLKIRILLEGQIDFNGATVLFNDEEFGYRKQFSADVILDKLKGLIDHDPERGNSYFFSAFIGYLLEIDRELIFRWMESAEQLGLKNENTYPGIGLYVLKGILAEKDGDKEEAVNQYFEAAKSYYFQAHYTEASKYLDMVLHLDPALNEAYKYSADIQYITSFINEPPFNDEKLITQAYALWHASPDLAVWQAKDAWFYIVIARIHEVRYKFSRKNILEDYWQSVLYTERALIWEPDNYSFRTYLGRFYRNLQLEANSMAAFADAAVLQEKEDEFLQEEMAIVQLNNGDYGPPWIYLQELRKNNINNADVFKPYHKSWEGYILFHQGKKKEALKLFEEVISEVSNDLFAYQMKMFCFWYTHQVEQAKETALEIIALGKKLNYPREEFSFSWAQFIAGFPDEAIEILEKLIGMGGHTRDIAFSLSQFYAYTGRINEAEKTFSVFIEHEHNKRILQSLPESLDVLESQFHKKNPQEDVSAKQLTKIVKEWKRRLKERMEFVSKKIVTPAEELYNRQAEYAYPPDSVEAVVIQAAIARMHRREERWTEALKAYEELFAYGDLFPEAKSAYEEICNEIFTRAGASIKESKFKEAAFQLSSVEMREKTGSNIKNMLLSLASFGLKQEDRGREYHQLAAQSMGTDRELHKLVWTALITKAYHPQLTWNFGHYVKNNLSSFPYLISTAWAESMKDEFWNGLINKSNPLFPVVTPIAIEVSKDLVVPESSSPDWHVLKNVIPAMREAILQKYGIRTPAVRIRDMSGVASPGTYIILLDEVPWVMGTSHPNKLFVPDAEEKLQKLSIDGDAAIHPATGKKAFWVDPKNKMTLNQNKIVFWEDPFLYITTHLEAVLSRRLELYVDIQFCDDYLLEAQQVYGDKSAARIAEEEDLLLLFNKTLKTLAQEQVPVLNKQKIIQSFMTACERTREVNDLVRAIRMEIKEDLPFNRLTLERIGIPKEVEEAVQRDLVTRDNKTFLAMTPDSCQEVLEEIKSHIGNNPLRDTKVLVVREPALRIHIRKLVELEFPNLFVAAEEELLNT